MKQVLLTLCTFLLLGTVAAQVGVNTNTPDAMLDIRAGSQTDPQSTDGILIPRVDTFPVANPAAAQQAMLVYLTTAHEGRSPGFYYWNNTSESWVMVISEENLLPGGGTLESAYNFGGAGAGRTITATGGAVHIAGTDGLQVTGEFDQGDTLSLAGAGTRMFFYPRKAAFRAGYVSEADWDNDSIGYFSAAMGGNARASGIGSTALGAFTRASGNTSTAIGSHASASGINSVAMGYYTEASESAAVAMGFETHASGENSTALGRLTEASGMASIAMGFGTLASEWYATAMGNTTEASGGSSTAMGELTIASGYASTAMGYETEANEDFSTSMGRGAVASGYASTAMGYDTEASGWSSTALGNSTRANEENATAMGNTTEASGYASTAMGSFTLASNLSSTAMGHGTVASGSGSIAMGYNTEASGENSTAMGELTIASGHASTAMGSYTKASGKASTAMGLSTWANGENATAIGVTTFAGGHSSIAMGTLTEALGFSSTAMGNSTKAIGSNSTAMGVGNTALSFRETVIGSYATTAAGSSSSWNTADRLFVVGNGQSSGSPGNALVILKNGNVGIGSNTPAERLHVAGNIRMEDGNQGHGKVLTSDVDGKASWQFPAASGGTLDSAYNFGGAGAGRTITATDGAVHITGTDGLQVTGGYEQGAELSLSGPGTRMFFYPRKAAFRAGNVSGTQWDHDMIGNYSIAMGYSTQASGNFSTAFGLFTEAGDHACTAMGYGTTAIGYQSTAMGAVTTASGAFSTAMGERNTAQSYAETVIGRYAITGTGSQSGWFETDRLFVVGNGTNNDARSNALVILKNGNTGIGISSPEEKLHVEGNIHLSGADRTIYNRSNNFLALGTNNLERMRITNTGNVGIGTDSPSELLHVEGNIRGTGNIMLSGGDRLINNLSNNSLSFATNNAQRMWITNTGNVGIGISNPAVSLQVEGNIHLSGGNRTIYNRSDNFLALGTNNLERMRITNDGNVGIGTNNPDSRLHVNGKTRLQGWMQIGATGPQPLNTVLELQNHVTHGAIAIAWSLYSDRRIKSDVKPIRYGLDAVMRLRPVQYIHHSSHHTEDKRLVIHESGAPGIGMLAQELYEVVPEVVNRPLDDTNELWSVDYTRLIPVLIKAIQEQQAEIDDQRAELNTQRSEILDLREKLARLESLVLGMTSANGN